jgi:choline dehydrogenase-like flavoprotein
MVMLSLHVVLACIASVKATLSDESFLNTTYDYIIIGGGTSGLTVANRLTENGKRMPPFFHYSYIQLTNNIPQDTVLVLEYGPLNNDSGILIPSDTLLSSPSRYYNITSLPIAGLNNATRPVLAGALVGGGSAVNGMFFDRGSAADYDAWQELGNPGWNFSTLLPYFRKSVTFTPPTADVARKYKYTWDEKVAYGGKGEVQVSFPPYQFPGREYLWAAWDEMGIKRPVESGGGNAIGAIQAPSALDPVSRTRSYARTAHYNGVIGGRPNYILRTGWRVMEVVTRGEGKTLEAVGVNISKRGGDGSKFVVKARKEVIIAAGAVWTPWLLQRSGIGPSPLLSQASIPLKKHLPGVGANFQDHPIGGALWNWTSNAPSPMQNDLVTNTSFYASALAEYTSSRTGPLTVARGNQAAFLPLSIVAPDTYPSLLAAISTQDPVPPTNLLPRGNRRLPRPTARRRLAARFPLRRSLRIPLQQRPARIGGVDAPAEPWDNQYQYHASRCWACCRLPHLR